MKKRSRGIRNESFDLFVYCWACLYELARIRWIGITPTLGRTRRAKWRVTQPGREAIKPLPVAAAQYVRGLYGVYASGY